MLRPTITLLFAALAVETASAATPQSVPSTMKAVAIDQPGSVDVMKLRTLPVPKVDANEVLIAVHSAGVAVWDGEIRQTMAYINNPRYPYFLGSDGAGVVAAVGAKITRFKVGDAVYAYCWDNPKGGFYAEYVAASKDCVGKLPKGLSLEAAGALGASGLTALSGVNRVLATASGDEGVALVRRLGADVAVDGRKADILAAARAFAPQGVDAVLALAGGEALAKCMEALREGGRVAYPNGVASVPKARPGTTLTPYDALFGDEKDQLAELNQAVEAMKFEVPIAATFRLEQVAAAHQRVAAGRVLGKVILKIR